MMKYKRIHSTNLSHLMNLILTFSLNNTVIFIIQVFRIFIFLNCSSIFSQKLDSLSTPKLLKKCTCSFNIHATVTTIYSPLQEAILQYPFLQGINYPQLPPNKESITPKTLPQSVFIIKFPRRQTLEIIPRVAPGENRMTGGKQKSRRRLREETTVVVVVVVEEEEDPRGAALIEFRTIR